MNPTVQRKPVADLELHSTKSSAIAQSTQSTYALIAVQGHWLGETAPEEHDRQALYIYELGFGLAQRGCQVDIFVRRDHLNQPEIVEHFPGFRTIRLTAGPTCSIPHNQVFEYLPAFVEAWLAFQHQSDRHYVLLHSSDWLSAWIGLQLKHLQRLPLVHTCHTVGALKYLWLENSTRIMSIRHSLEQACLEQADCVVVPNEQEVEDLRQMLPVQGQIETIPYGVNTEHFGGISSTIARQKLGIASKTRLIVYVGWFDPFQGIETLIKACTLLPKPFQLWLVNDSDEDGLEFKEAQFIRTLARQLDLEECITVFDRVSRSQLPMYYAAADVCVVPSYYQSSTAVALESMASGTPVIASDIGRLQNVVIHGSTGLLIPPHDPNMLSAALWEVFRSPFQWKFYGIAARSWVRLHFSRAAMATQMEMVYQSLTPKMNDQTAFVHPVTSSKAISLKSPRRNE